jgi:hypothetical protein
MSYILPMAHQSGTIEGGYAKERNNPQQIGPEFPSAMREAMSRNRLC